MLNFRQSIFFTGLAAAIVLGGTLSAVETASTGARMGDQQGKSPLHGRNDGISPLGRWSDLTVFDHGNSSEEIAMTVSIRTAIRENGTLSKRAINVTIITKKSQVVLRGEVDSAAEKTIVEDIAQDKAGPQNVTSELIVALR